MERTAVINRKTKETAINCKLNLDGTGKAEISTGVGFLDHMLDIFAFHSGFDLNLKCDGDLHICPHHTIEDIAIALGECLKLALGDCKGIVRYADNHLAMDETLVRTAIDIAGRPVHVYQAELKSPQIGDFPTEMTKHFFYSFCVNSKMTLHQAVLYGENDHHKVEALFKGLARCLSTAASLTGLDQIPSSKGII